MEINKLRKMIELIAECSDSSEGTWQEKRDEVKAEATEHEQACIDEFVAWFS